MLRSPDVWVVYDPDANPNEPKDTKEAPPAGIGTEPFLCLMAIARLSAT